MAENENKPEAKPITLDESKTISCYANFCRVTGSPEELGSLKGQDVGKLVVAAILIVGVLMSSMAAILGPDQGIGKSLVDAVKFLKDVMLT